jgi:adenylate kinase family enzyme
VQHVYDKIVYAIRPYLENRLAKWDRVDLMKINPDRITSFLENCIVKESRFGRLNPLTLLRPIKPLPLLYNNRMYYLDDEEQREAVMDNIALLRSNMPVPKDVSVTPIVFIIGKPKTGKGSLAKLISKKLGLVIIKIKHIVQQFATEHRDPTIDKILQIARSGEVLSDELVVDLIERRVQLADCVTRGWILDGMPRNKSQAEILIKRGLAPSAVFSLQLSDNDIKKRVAATKSNKYGYDPSVVNERIQRYKDDLIAMENYFMNKYNNIRFLDGRISKWGVY